MVITEKMSRAEYDNLPRIQKSQILMELFNIRKKYITAVQNGMTVDLPYFFWSLWKMLFKDEEHVDFLKIDDADQFGVAVVYFLSRYMNVCNTGGAK